MVSRNAEEGGEEEVECGDLVAVEHSPDSEAHEDADGDDVEPHTVGVGDEGGLGASWSAIVFLLEVGDDFFQLAVLRVYAGSAVVRLDMILNVLEFDLNIFKPV